MAELVALAEAEVLVSVALAEALASVAMTELVALAEAEALAKVALAEALAAGDAGKVAAGDALPYEWKGVRTSACKLVAAQQL
jgi:hypothetical protein